MSTSAEQVRKSLARAAVPQPTRPSAGTAGRANAFNNGLPGISATFVVLAALGSMAPPAAVAAERWFLLSRHGDCTDIGVLKRKVPDLGEVSDPHGFADFMRKKGLAVTSTQLPVPKGRAEEVRVPQKELFLMFVTSELCRGSGAR